MNIINLSNFVLPIIVLFIIIYSYLKKVSVYDTFVEGAKEGVKTALGLFPFMLAMLLGVNLFLKSGIINDLITLINPLLEKLKLQGEILPLAILRPISGSAATGIVSNIFLVEGPDSLLGRIASIMLGSTDTTIYIVALYFSSLGIKKIKNALWLGLFTDLIAIISSIVLVKIFF